MLQSAEILFIGHDYHRHTQSSQFFHDVLSELGTVEDLYDDSYLAQGRRRDYRTLVEARNYSLIVVWQIEYAAEQLAGLSNVVFVPMFDSCRLVRSGFWRNLAGMRVLAFSLEVLRWAQEGGCSARYVQFWPEKPDTTTPVQRRADRAFYWYRRNDVSLSRLEWITQNLKIRDLVIQHHPDPTVVDPLPERAFAERLSPTLHFTTWQADRSALRAELAQAGCYVASRAYEGIGMAFLEAMTEGCAVVAPRNATYTDYIVSGETGYLYDAHYPMRLDPAAVSRIGAAAAEAARLGRAQWLASIPALLDWLHSGTGTGAILPAVRSAESPVVGGSGLPIISVVTVVRNAPEALARTIASVAAQRGVAFAFIIVDGQSDDDTLAVARAHADSVDQIVSRADAGIYDAMNRSLEFVTSPYVLFMNAGDTFVGPDSLAELMAGAAPDDDVVFGHHLYCRADGTAFLHRANAFAETLDALQLGRLTDAWEHGLPCHQATVTRTALLRALPYRVEYTIAADRDFLFRAAQTGARFRHVDRYVARYEAGGFSAQRPFDCVREWQAIALAHTGDRARVRSFYALRLLEAFEHQMMRSGLFGAVWLMIIHAGVLLGALGRADLKVVARHLVQNARAVIRRARDASGRLSLDFGAHNRSSDLACVGFSPPETHGSWTDRAEAEIILPVRSGPFVEVNIVLRALSSQLAAEPIGLFANDTLVGRFIFRRGHNRIALPQPMAVRTLRFDMPATLSLRDLGTGADERSLGLMLARLVLR